MIDLEEGRYFIGIWFVFGEGHERDVLAVVFRDQGSSRWELRYRIREYSPDSTDPFDGKDTRKSWRATSGESEAEVFAKTQRAVSEIAATTGMQVDYLDLRTDDPTAILDKLKTRPWAHMKEYTKDEAEKLGITNIERPKPSRSKHSTPPGRKTS